MNVANITKTLLLREWMQHKRGWLILAAVPFVVILLGITFGNVRVGEDEGEALVATPLAAMLGAAALASTLALMWLAVLLQAPGLARRDVQDRSIEFWLSLPTPAWLSVAVTLLAHLLLAPWFAIVCGLVGAALLAPLVVVKAFGFSALADVPWTQLAGTGLAMGLRIAIGLALATLWASPLILGAMAASAWLKRWGVPALAGLLAIGGGLERAVFGTQGIHQSVGYLGQQAGLALVGASGQNAAQAMPKIEGPNELARVLPHAVNWIFGDLAAALQRLATPGFAAALAIGAAMFLLLVIRRQRGG